MEELDHFEKDKLTINLVKTNLLGFVFIVPIFMLYRLPDYLIWVALASQFY